MEQYDRFGSVSPERKLTDSGMVKAVAIAFGVSVPFSFHSG